VVRSTRLATFVCTGLLSQVTLIASRLICVPLLVFAYISLDASLRTGAMENWGLLLFDEKRFLVNPSTEGEYEKQECRNVICHEVVRVALECGYRIHMVYLAM
jgi:hypothetical protein